MKVLVYDETSPDQPGVTKHEGEEPDDPRRARFIEEGDLEAGEVDLRLLAGWRLEANLERLGRLRPDVAHRALHDGVTAREAALLELAMEADGRPTRIGREPFAQIG